ncbi:MAG: hypothetical protein HOU81_25195 [Hamadaea sp.]|uniref:hypothetical protein n=1 Tax=Hamadaea sp. TaxID=2024425 RepID=UPI00181F7D30|nr:hypothetical protein [Hamadaea sp.]NUR74118.1 hypothetical protein [Hamadaea sp.]NUT19975.1 hypothetical protein [Hamadaea sp.]
MRPVEDSGGVLAEFTAPLRSGGYGLPPGGAAHAHDHGTNGVSTSVRTAVHNGHEIRIETTYAITIDGKPLQGGLEVLDNGAVHYHGLPQYALPSAIDLCKRVLDYFGTEPPAADELGCLVGEHGENCACPEGEPGHPHSHEGDSHPHSHEDDSHSHETHSHEGHSHSHEGHVHEHGEAHQ